VSLSFWLAALPLWLYGLLIIGVSVTAAAGHFYVRKTVRFEKLVVNNEVAGFKYATLSVIYAVLLAFVVFTVWEEFRDAETRVMHEAGAVLSLYRLSVGLPEQIGKNIRKDLRRYTETVINEEWPTMARGEASPSASAALIAVLSNYITADVQTERQREIYSASLQLLAEVNKGRLERLDSADGTIPSVLWFTLIVGATLVVIFPFFFGTPNLWAQVSMTALLCLMVLLMLLVTLSLNHPFTGDAVVSPEPFERVIESMTLEQSEPASVK
jgi:Protein of unknown function (DUF4239)